MLIGLAVGGPAGIAAGPLDKVPLVTAHLCSAGELQYVHSQAIQLNRFPN